MTKTIVYKTMKGTDILVEKGEKSKYDFIVKYRERGKRIRTPKHIHILVDLYIKQAKNEKLTMKFIDHIINCILPNIEAVDHFPVLPRLFKEEQLDDFKELNNYGEYSMEFLLVVIELIMTQEKTNYPDGIMNVAGFRKFREKADIFSVVSAAAFRGR